MFCDSLLYDGNVIVCIHSLIDIELCMTDQSITFVQKEKTKTFFQDSFTMARKIASAYYIPNTTEHNLTSHKAAIVYYSLSEQP